jgi:hypothetical protein
MNITGGCAKIITAVATKIDFGDLPTWLTAMTAVLAAIIGLRTYRGRTQDRKKELERDLRRQATTISAWISREAFVTFKNASTAPAYELVATCVNVASGDSDGRSEVPQGRLYRRTGLRILAPGESQECAIPDWGGGVPARRDSIELAFTDSNGTHWVRTGRGRLVEICANPLDYYGFRNPYPW